MPAPLPVLINRCAGAAAALGERLEAAVRAAFAKTGREIALELLRGSDMPDALRRHAGSPVIAVGGGDGTLSMAAQALAGTRTALGVLPLGTANHLVCALALPLDLDEAASIAASGERRRMDLARCGKRIFVNSVSVGSYSVLAREHSEREFPKWLGTMPAAWHVLRTMRPQHHRLRIDGQTRSVRSPLLFIGNSRFSLDPQSLSGPGDSGDGELSLCAIRAAGLLQLAWLAFKVLLGLTSSTSDFVAVAEARSITIEGTGEIGIAFDGEVERASLPLQLDLLPSALGVVGPRVPAGCEALFSRTH